MYKNIILGSDPKEEEWVGVGGGLGKVKHERKEKSTQGQMGVGPSGEPLKSCVKYNSGLLLQEME